MIGDFAELGGEMFNLGDGIDAVNKNIGAVDALNAAASKTADTFESMYGADADHQQKNAD